MAHVSASALHQKSGMLLLDRFLHSTTSSLDLATGQAVRLRVIGAPTRVALFAARGAWRMVDAGPRSRRSRC